MIPKESNPKHIDDFRPINLIGCIFRLLYKVLAKRLSKVLNYIIGECEHAFVYGRQISDAILIVNEIADEVIRHNMTGTLCKLDMENFFDHVIWNFIDYMLNKMGFGAKWRGWIRSCISTASFAIIVNGGPSSFITATRGLRQGDPFFPLLFIIVMEAPNKFLEKAKELQHLKGVSMGGNGN